MIILGGIFGGCVTATEGAGLAVNVYFIGVLLAVLMLVTYVPAIPMALVELFYR